MKAVQDGQLWAAFAPLPGQTGLGAVLARGHYSLPGHHFGVQLRRELYRTLAAEHTLLLHKPSKGMTAPWTELALLVGPSAAP